MSFSGKESFLSKRLFRDAAVAGLLVYLAHIAANYRADL